MRPTTELKASKHSIFQFIDWKVSLNCLSLIIAEGFETKEQKDFLIENGCENIQGYYYSKPIPANEMEVILSKGCNHLKKS